jgi:hypothetical protein
MDSRAILYINMILGTLILAAASFYVIASVYFRKEDRRTDLATRRMWVVNKILVFLSISLYMYLGLHTLLGVNSTIIQQRLSNTLLLSTILALLMTSVARIVCEFSILLRERKGRRE